MANRFSAVVGLALGVVACSALAATPADVEAFLDAARRTYPTDAWKAGTNTLVTGYQVAAADFADRPAPGGRIRWHRVDGMRNVRDLGGWNGLPTGRVFRGSEPDCQPVEKTGAKKFHNLNVTAEGLRTMRETLGIRTDLDLRGDGECPHPEKSALGVSLVRVPLAAYMGAFSGTNLYAKALRVFADAGNYPVYFHCWGGADRTGTIAYLLEGLCGVNETDLAIDYELTSFTGLFGVRRRDRTAQFPQFVAQLRTYPGATMAERIAAYMETTLGFSRGEIANLRRNLGTVNPPPERQVTVIAESNRTEFAVSLPARPDPAEVYAATEFVDCLERQTGVRLAVVTNGVQDGRRVVSLASGNSKSDGFDVRIENGNVQIRGESPRGTLYAVYDLLERFGGCGWYAPWRTVVPRTGRFALPNDLNLHERPAFLWRQPSWYQVRKNPRFAACCRLNGETPDGEGPVEDPKFGGHPFRFVRRLYSSHTFYVLVPPEEHFHAHPDWFSQVDGRRLPAEGQLCLSNPAVVDATVKRALELAAKDPGATVLGVSQMDWGGHCACPACKAVRDEEGSVAGPLLRFVNAVAEQLEKVRPELQVETLAYYDSFVPPRKTRPRRNVMMCCCVDGDYTEPFETAKKASNLAWKEKFETWTKWTDNIILWDYTPNFAWHHVPQPTVDVFGPNLRYYRRHGVKGVYMDGLSVPSGNFGDLKCWMLSKLVWNPDQSTEALMNRFFAGCYGAAAAKAREVYEVERRAYAAKRDQRLPFYTEDRPEVFTDADLDRTLRLWREAENAVSDDADALFAVRMAKYSSVVLRCQRLLTGIKEVNLSSRPDVGELTAEDRRVLDEERQIREAAAARGITVHHSLGRGRDEWLKRGIERLRSLPTSVPPASSAVLGLDHCILPLGDFSGGEWNERVDRKGSLESDASAIGGKSFRLRLAGDSDVLTWRFARIAFDADRSYRIRLHLRVTGSGTAGGEALRAILWDEVKGFGGECRPAAASPTENWQWVEVGTMKLSPTLKLVVKPPRPAERPSTMSVHVDAIDIAAVDAYQAIEQAVAASDAAIASAQARLKDACSLTDYAAAKKVVNGKNAWTAALQTALREHEIVRIPAASEPYFIDATVVIPSNRRIEAEGATIALAPGTRVLMLRNENAPDGTLAPIPAGSRNRNIAIVGGRWEDCERRRLGYGSTGRFDLDGRKIGGHYGVSTLFYFGNCDEVSVRNVTFFHTSGFSVQSGDGARHLYENIRFEQCHADGLHLNGNLSEVHVRNVRGQVGDDLIALNAYDWLNSSVNFGPQRNFLCEDLELLGGYPAIRILPAKFRYADGSIVDCAISNVVFRRVKGIKTFKMYLQTPRYRIGTKPEWSGIGSGGNLFFDDIDIDLSSPIDNMGQYRDSEPLRGHFGAFEFGANLSSVHFRNIDITFHLDKFPLSHLAVVGPKSCFFPEKDGKPGMEIFDPYVSCRVGRVTVEGIKVHGAAPKELVRATVFDDINHDGNSSGRGVIEQLEIK